MKPRLAAIFAIIILVPLGLLGWLAWRLARDEREMVGHRLVQLMTLTLEDARAPIRRLTEQLARDTEATLRQTPRDAASLRAVPRRDPRLLQLFQLGPDGSLLFPPAGGGARTSDAEFLERTRGIWSGKNAFYLPDSDRLQNPGSAQPGQSSWQLKSPTAPASRNGWYSWYWGNSPRLLYWLRDVSGEVVGVEIDNMRLLADIVAVLPETDPAKSTLRDACIRLKDPRGEVVYQWGGYAASLPADQPPRASVHLDLPLQSWRLDYFAPPDVFAAGRSALVFNMLVGLALAAFALVVLAVYFYRESTRELREAAQRVSFVNQVSHELKTPLTNIRLYAELLDREIPPDDEKMREHLDVVVTESQRLSRLIANILTFSRQQRQTLRLHMAPGIIDEAVASVIGYFRPSLEGKGVAIEFHPGAPRVVTFDADALGQILGNLFSNVEKYAAAGGLLTVTSRQDDERTIITVADHGPGIGPRERDRVFQPFYRVHDSLTEGVAGTGIGLPIARDLARRHGGDLVLLPAEKGAAFQLTIHTPEATQPVQQEIQT
jgi:signal transduction histidine kinase